MKTTTYIDHVVLAAQDLERACADFERTTTIRPAFGGAHPGGGTHNALVAFDPASYLEIIAPDPAQARTPMSAAFDGLARPTLTHWAVRCSGLLTLADRLRARAWTPTEVRRMSRTPPNGARLDWELFGLRDHPYGGLAPFFIDWFDSPHPATTSPRVGALTQLRIAAPEPARLRELMTELGIDVAVDAAAANLELRFASPRGEVGFSGRSPPGFTLGR
ncbi:MAG TPA: VOC family protein [Pseudomonadales bacterium]